MTCETHTFDVHEPTGYIGWHSWARDRAKTHKQSRCPDCGLWKIWTQRTEATP